PKKPLPSSKVPILAIGVMLGLCFSTTTVLFLESRDKSIKTLKEVRELFRYPLLGVIPFLGKKASFLNGKTKSTIPEIPARDKPFSQVSELYRMIQTKLKLRLDKKLKTIVVTSSVPQEGKSTVSANFAVTLAQLGRRVLLIDADLRHPAQHQIWEISNATGLSEVIIGKTDLETTVCQVMDNLDVLTAGTMPPNPLAIFDSQSMAALMQEVSEQYDFVIIDTPPLTLAAHTLTLNQMTDGTILVTRLGLVDVKSVNATKEILEQLDRKVLGLVVNGVIHKDELSGYLKQDQNYFIEENSTISEPAKNYQHKKYLEHF
ncbi:MAG: polysaccharide biosynthesis tyrosine autokinase, partial [Microcoleus sp. SIO2G3]|nr:polysaccharide biosynthesis tyrosine autokinase [Microcoleus sp. SIO2G3]